MDENEIPCKLIPDMFWCRAPASYHIWYMCKRNERGVCIPRRGKNNGYCVVFDPVVFPGVETTLEQQMHLEEIKWMMGE